MKRFQRHKVKEEKPEPSQSRDTEEHDLAYYIHDRVELMHQVFTVVKQKDLKSMIPECIRNLSKDDLQELCTEELLGISSKRLCAILDGAEPPSDTESSSQSPERLETISLDSISSDEEMLSQSSKKKRHKHKKHSKSKRKRTVTNDSDKTDKTNKDGGETQSRAARAGLTVLELLELQARARAIRAQLHNEQAKLASSAAARSEEHASSDEDAVLIKEEAPLVVEISSDEEKPNVEHLAASITKSAAVAQKQSNTPAVNTKNTKDLTVNVPVAKKTRKIKLNRNKSVIENKEVTTPSVVTTSSNKSDSSSQVSAAVSTKTIENKNKETKKVKKSKKKKQNNEDGGSDQDEITLQLSDTEKMDLLDDFEGTKHNSSGTEDTDSSSDSDESVKSQKSAAKTNEETDIQKSCVTTETVGEAKTISKDDSSEIVKKNDLEEVKTELANIELTSSEVTINRETKNEEINKSVEEIETNIETQLNISVNEANTVGSQSHFEEPMEVDDVHIEITNVSELPVVEDDKIKENDKPVIETNLCNVGTQDADNKETLNKISEEIDTASQKKTLQIIVQGNSRSVQSKITDPASIPDCSTDKNMSEGELSNAESSEVEVVVLKPEVVCISDEEAKKNKHKKKEKKKEKKAKKEKKKKKSDFREAVDENFFTEKIIEIDQNDLNRNNDKVINSPKDKQSSITIVTDEEQSVNETDDAIYEILELSDSSCYEFEGVSVLSKEPTADEIEALSAKIDEYDREDVITDEQIQEHERITAAKQITDNNVEQIEKLSWKERYLDSKKVKQILFTSNILNAMRKKNIELKKKIAESKKELIIENKVGEEPEIKESEEGSIEQYNTLIGSTTFVDPVPEKQNGDATIDNDNDISTNQNDSTVEKQVTREMKKDAKQLLKMYKKLLKYNDMNRVEDPNKKKKKKLKKKREKNSVLTPTT